MDRFVIYSNKDNENIFENDSVLKTKKRKMDEPDDDKQTSPL